MIPRSDPIVRFSKNTPSLKYRPSNRNSRSELCQETLEKAVDSVDVLVKQGFSLSRNDVYNLLLGCSKSKDLECGRRVQSFTVYSGLDSVSPLADHLIRLFSSSGRLLEANQTFGKVADPSAYTWAATILANARLGQGEVAILLYHRTQLSDMKRDKYIYVAALKACTMTKSMCQGMIVHGEVVKSGLQSDVVLGSILVDMYGKCGNLEMATEVFNQLVDPNVMSFSAIITGYTQHGDGHMAVEWFQKMQQEGIKPDVVLWSAMISGYAQHGEVALALQCFDKMQQQGITPNEVTFLSILKACTSVQAIQQGKLIHVLIIKDCCHSDVIIGSALIDMYAKSGSIEVAHDLFLRLCRPNVALWNALLGGYVENEEYLIALEFYDTMQADNIEPDEVTFLCVLKACATMGIIEQGRRVHGKIVKTNFQSNAVGNTLVDMYCKCGSLKEACDIFNRLSIRDMVTWNAMILGHVYNGEDSLALECFESLSQEDVDSNDITFVGILKACASLGDIDYGRGIHQKVVEIGLQSDVLTNTLLDMYAKCGRLEEAQKLFSELPNRNVVSWNTIIAGYSHNGQCLLALKAFEKMQEENVEPNIVSWGAIISGCVQHGECSLALDCFEKMQQEGIEPNEVLLSGIINACANIEALEQGRLIHEQFIGTRVQLDIAVGNSLVDMYAKCGSLEEAENIFNIMFCRNVISWNSMIAAYAHHGKDSMALECFTNMQHESIEPDVASWGAIIGGYVQHDRCLLALRCFHEMQEGGVRANEVVLSLILKACANLGAIEQGRIIHRKIREDGIESDLVIGSTLVDMYAKCGSLEEACKVFNILPDKSLVSWNAMLAGYAYHGECYLALECFEQMQQQGIKPDQSSFTSILIACSRAGSVNEGLWCFESRKEYNNFALCMPHCTCIVDLLGRAGFLSEAEDLLHSALETDIMGWMSLLNACRMFGDLKLGRYCFDYIMHLDACCAAGYVLMSNIYAEIAWGTMLVK